MTAVRRQFGFGYACCFQYDGKLVRRTPLLRRLFVEQVKMWRQICEDANQRAEKISIDNRQESKIDKQRIHLLERELQRKEKALAEAAALLILRKKLDAFYSESEDV